MTQQQAIEFVQMHHPTIAPNVIRLWLNDRLRRFCADAGVNRDYVEYTSTAGQPKYALTASMLDVYRVDYDGVRLDRLPGEPPYIADATSVSTEEVGP